MAQLIDDPEAFRRVLPRLADAPRWAVDTESDSYFAYAPRVCLIQVSIPGHDLLLDPLADLDPAPFGELLADPAREIVMHAAENDVIQFHDQYGWRIGNLFDTQVACFVLGTPPYSLAGVLEARFGVELDKSQQRSDWSQRPLSAEQREYAAEDTRYLLELADELKSRALEAGRMEEIAYECTRIASRTWEPVPFDPEGFRRIGGARDLDERGLRILRDLYLMRNEEAEKRNWAPFRIVPDHVLARIARERRARPGKGIPQPFWRRYGERVARIVADSKGGKPLPRPRRGPRRGEPLEADVKDRYERLRRWRNAAAAERGVETWVVARNELLLELARGAPRTRDGLAGMLEPFRLREYGEAILGALLASPGDRPDNG